MNRSPRHRSYSMAEHFGYRRMQHGHIPIPLAIAQNSLAIEHNLRAITATTIQLIGLVETLTAIVGGVVVHLNAGGGLDAEARAWLIEHANIHDSTRSSR